MRYTLEQLKAMSPDEIHRIWFCSEFPFDAALACGHCITSHDVEYACTLEGHADFRARVKELWQKMRKVDGRMGEAILQNIEEFYALRLFYDSFYKQAEANERIFARMEEAEWDSRANTR